MSESVLFNDRDTLPLEKSIGEQIILGGYVWEKVPNDFELRVILAHSSTSAWSVRIDMIPVL